MTHDTYAAPFRHYLNNNKDRFSGWGSEAIMFDYARVMDGFNARPLRSQLRSHRRMLESGPDGGMMMAGTGLRRGLPSPAFAAGSLAVLLGLGIWAGADLTPLTDTVESIARMAVSVLPGRQS